MGQQFVYTVKGRETQRPCIDGMRKSKLLQRLQCL